MLSVNTSMSIIIYRHLHKHPKLFNHIRTILVIPKPSSKSSKTIIIYHNSCWQTRTPHAHQRHFCWWNSPVRPVPGVPGTCERGILAKHPPGRRRSAAEKAGSRDLMPPPPRDHHVAAVKEWRINQSETDETTKVLALGSIIWKTCSGYVFIYGVYHMTGEISSNNPFGWGIHMNPWKRTCDN
jgi:hypothetical protein